MLPFFLYYCLGSSFKKMALLNYSVIRPLRQLNTLSNYFPKVLYKFIICLVIFKILIHYTLTVPLFLFHIPLIFLNKYGA